MTKEQLVELMKVLMGATQEQAERMAEWVVAQVAEVKRQEGGLRKL